MYSCSAGRDAEKQTTVSTVHCVRRVQLFILERHGETDNGKYNALERERCTAVQLGETRTDSVYICSAGRDTEKQRAQWTLVLEMYSCQARRDTEKQTAPSTMHCVRAAKLGETRRNRQLQCVRGVQLPS